MRTSRLRPVTIKTNPELHKEPLKYENIKIATRNYKD